MIKKIMTNRVVLNTLVLTTFIFSLEMIIRIFIDAGFTDISALFRIFLSSLIVGLTIADIGHFLPKLGQKILNIIMILAIGIYEFVEFGLYGYIGFFMGVGNAEQGTKVTEFIKDFMSSYKLVHWTILIPVLLFILYYIIIDRLIMKNKQRNKLMSMVQKVYIEVVTLVIIVLLCGGYYYTVRSEKFQNELQTESNYSLWLYPEDSNLTVNNFGVLVFGFTDIKSQILGIDADYVLNLEMQNATTETNTTTEEVEADLKREIDDTAWNTLIENTTDSTYKTLNNYFINRTISQKNEYTGIFKGKNLIIIMMESTNEISIMNEEYFPTLYKLYHEGISFKNNYSPRNSCSTGNNEFTVLSSLFTINNLCTTNAYASSNTYFEGAFNMFNNIGYTTAAFHDYTEKFYKRSKILPHLGASKYYGVEDLGISYSTSYTEADDQDMFKAAKQYYMDEDNFMVYFATVSPHQSYISSQTCSDRYYDKYRALGYSANLSRYLSKMQVLDEALAELLNELEEEGILDDTVIALFGDHYPYGLTDDQINEFFNANNAGYTINRYSTTNKNVDKTPMIIYNSTLEPMVVEEYTTIIDLLPTLLNMFDIDYDPRLYLGIDIFSTSHVSRAVFADGSWTNERGYYHASTSKMTYLDGALEYTSAELKVINQEISTRQKMSASAIKSNYFKYLGEGLEKYKVVSVEESESEE